jgi:hypothetical protein
MGASASCVGGGGRADQFGVVSKTKMKPEEYEILMHSVEDLMAIKDGPTTVGILAFKGLFVELPDTFPIFDFESADW